MKDPLFDKTLDEPLSGENDVPAEWIARVHSELRRGERLIWVGQPQSVHFARQALPIVIFAAIWTTFSLFFVVMLILASFGVGRVSGEPAIGWLIVGLFLLIGFAMLSSPYWLWRKARQTCYALTSRRAILWEAGSFGSVEVRSYEPADLAKLYRVEYPRGGDLVFEEAYTIGQNSDHQSTAITKRHGFLGIENVHEVEEFLRRTLLKLDD